VIESGLFKIQAKHRLWFRQQRRGSEQRQKIIDSVYRNAVAKRDGDELAAGAESGLESIGTAADPYDGVTQSFVLLSNLPTCPPDRLSRYEVTLWRQARQIVLTLQRLDQRKPWERPRMG
jgi:hypothetical protein